MSVATKGQHSKEVLELLQSIQDTEKDQMSWKDSTKALDKMEDLSEDGEENPVDGTTIMKEGKYKNGKMSMALKDIYTTDKNYVEWVRSHIDKTSSKEMQRLKVYTLCRDQTKKHRLLIEQGVKTRVPELGKAKNKAIPRGVKNPRGAVSASSMEWSYVENQGHEEVILEMMTGMPVRQVSPLQPSHSSDERGLMMEMQMLLSTVLGNPEQ